MPVQLHLQVAGAPPVPWWRVQGFAGAQDVVDAAVPNWGVVVVVTVQVLRGVWYWWWSGSGRWWSRALDGELLLASLALRPGLCAASSNMTSRLT